MVTDLVLASPPDLMASAIVLGRARLTDSQSGKRFFRFSKARSLFTSDVDWERIVIINSSRGSSVRSFFGMPYVASRFCVMYLVCNLFSVISSDGFDDDWYFAFITIFSLQFSVFSRAICK